MTEQTDAGTVIVPNVGPDAVSGLEWEPLTGSLDDAPKQGVSVFTEEE